MSRFSPEGDVFMSGTFMGHLHGVTAALETIDILRDGKVHKELWRKGNRMAEEINKTIDSLELNARCNSFGSIWNLYFTREVNNFRDIIHMTKEGKGYPADMAFRHALLNAGIFVQPNYTNRAFISAAHSDEDIDRTIDVTQEFLKEHQEDLR
jgi:glutamate-1-semialdehyde 2,1-aminomutase